MSINKENIEAYLLDRLEGNLTPSLEKELELFLLLNPEYRELADSLEDMPALPSDKTAYPEKQSLFKYSFSSAEEAFVKELEGDLTLSEKAELEDMLKRNPQLEKERGRFALTVLQPEQINYPFKEQLKRRTGIVITLYPHLSRIAALFIIALVTGSVLYYFLTDETENISPVVSEVKTDTASSAYPRIVVSPEENNSNKLASVVPVVNAKKEKAKPTIQKDKKVQATEPVLPAGLNTMASIDARIPQIQPAKTIQLPAPVLITELPSVAHAYNDDSKYLDIYQLASRFVNKFSKGKVDFNHQKNGEHSFTELAVNAGDFEFVRKKSK